MRFALAALFLLLVCNAPATAQVRRDKKKNINSDLVKTPASVALLVQTPVQSELSFSQSQAATITEIAERFRAMEINPAGNVDPRLLPPRERLALRIKLRDAEAKLLQQLDRTLTAAQWKRLAEIELQLHGVDVLYIPDVERRLGITDDQFNQIAKLRRDSYTELGRMKSALRKGKTTREDKKFYKEAVQKIQLTTNEKIFAVLSASQRSRLKTLLGKPFDVSKVRAKFKRVRPDRNRKPMKRPDV